MEQSASQVINYLKSFKWNSVPWIPRNSQSPKQKTLLNPSNGTVFLRSHGTVSILNKKLFQIFQIKQCSFESMEQTTFSESASQWFQKVPENSIFFYFFSMPPPPPLGLPQCVPMVPEGSRRF